MNALIHSSPRMEVTRTFNGMYQVELRDKARLRQGRGILLLTEAEMVELCRLGDCQR